MASPQVENGYTRLSNELIEALARIRIPGEAMQVLWTILRKTYGFQKTEDSIPLSQFCLATGLPKSSVIRGIKKLEELKIIYKNVTPKAVFYRIHKDYTTWRPFTKKQKGYEKVNEGLPFCKQKGYEKVPLKRKKEIIQKKNMSMDTFNKFWQAYPKKKAKQDAIKAWNRLKPNEELISIILEDIKIRKESSDWSKNKGQYIPYPATWLNGRRWEDQVVSEPLNNEDDPFPDLQEL